MAHSLNLFTRLRVSPRLALPAILLAIAAFLRFASLEHFGMLYDEHITRAVVENIWTGDLRNNWKYAKVPVEFRRDMFNFSSYMYADALAAGPHPQNPVRRERAFSAALGTLALAFFYAAAAELFNPAIALAVLAIGAVFPLLVQDSHYARPESFVLALCGLIYLLSVRLLKSSRPSTLLAGASFLCGLLIACKISLIPMAFVPLACLWHKQLFNLKTAAIWAAFVAAGAFAGVPNAFFHPHEFMSGVAYLRHEYANELMPHSLIDSRFCYRLLIPYFFQTAGALFCILLLIGAFVLGLRKKLLESLILTFPIALYVGYFAFQRTFFERNLSHVVPLAAMVSAVGLHWLAHRFSTRYRPAIFATLLALVVAQPAWNSFKLVFKAMRSITEERAHDYEARLRGPERLQLGPFGDLQTPAVLADVLYATNHSAGEFILRAHDFNDRYTERGFEKLKRMADVQEIGRFPSIFQGFSPSTLHVYQSWALRYIRVTPPDSYQDNGHRFVSWAHVSGTLVPAEVKTFSFAKAAIPSEHRTGKVTEYFGSYEPKARKKKFGRLDLINVPVRGLKFIGIPIITSRTAHRLSVRVVDHASGHILARADNPMPVLPLWDIWQVALAGSAVNAVDVIAFDTGEDADEWLGVGFPLRVSSEHN